MNKFLMILIVSSLLYLMISQKNDLVEGLNTFVGRMAVDDQYFYDKTFDDVFYYPNEPSGITGWDRCCKECPYRCVEYGVTGNASCFPY